MQESDEAQLTLALMEHAMQNGYNKYCLICYEKDYKHCHRYLIAKELERRGTEWEEMK